MFEGTVDKEKMKEQMVIDFSTAQVKQSRAVESSTQDKNREKLKQAKQHAEEELQKFEEATREYVEKLSYLNVTGGLEHMVEEVFLDHFLYNMIAPLVRGEEIPGVPKSEYNEVRKALYRDIIKTYIEN